MRGYAHLTVMQAFVHARREDGPAIFFIHRMLFGGFSSEKKINFSKKEA
jgi:hypothetical protein